MWNKVITKGPVLYHSTYLRYQKNQIHRDRKENGGYQGLGVNFRQRVKKCSKEQFGREHLLIK